VATTEALVLNYSPRFAGIELPVMTLIDSQKGNSKTVRKLTKTKS